MPLLLAALGLMGWATAGATCFESSIGPDVITADSRVETDPIGAIRDLDAKLQSSIEPFEAAKLLAVQASAYEVLDDNSRSRSAAAAARKALVHVPESAAKSALELRLDVLEADDPLSVEDMRASLGMLTQLEATVPARSLARACLLLVRSRLNIYLMRDEESTADALAAQRIAQIMNTPGIEADAAYQLAMSYKEFGLLEDGLRLADQAAQFHRAHGMTALLSNDLYVRSEIHERMRSYEAALTDLEEARTLNAQLHEDIDVALDEEHICGVLIAMHEVARAREACGRAEPVLAHAGRYDMLSLLVDHLASADLLENHVAAAAARITPLLDEHAAGVPRRALLRLYRTRADALSKLGRNDDALADMREVARLDGLNAAEQQDLKADRVRTRLRNFVVTQENAALSAELERQQAAAAAQKKRMRIYRVIAALVLVSCGLVAAVMWGRARRERQQREQRETLLKEIHHRVKNNLQIISSLLNLQARALDERTVRAFAESSQNRIRSMALVHEHLYQSVRFDRVSMQAYLGRLLETISQSQDRQDIQCEVSAGTLMLTTEQASTCGLIVNEIATNAFKHAFPQGGPGTISVSMLPTSQGIVELVIRDTGVGSAPGRVSASHESFGMRLVEMLVSQLEGTLHVNRDSGTEFRMRFPAAA